MRYTPRKVEVDAIVAVLESDEFDSPEQMAKALLREAANHLQQRDWVALAHVWENGEVGLNFGPFGNVAEAESFAGKLGAGGRASVVPLASPTAITDLIDGKKGSSELCGHAACGHAAFMHLMDGSSRGKCALEGCRCGGWSS